MYWLCLTTFSAKAIFDEPLNKTTVDLSAANTSLVILNL